MDFIPPVSCPKDAPLQLAHNLDNHLQLSIMDTYQIAEETPRCFQHKNPPPHSGRPLARLRHKRIDAHPHRTTTPITTTIRKLRLSAFGHICRLQPGVTGQEYSRASSSRLWGITNHGENNTPRELSAGPEVVG